MLYFAYGSCMDRNSFSATVDSKYYTVLGSAILRDYKLVFNYYSTNRCGGVADVVSSKGDYVEGVLYDLYPEGLFPLDEREGVPYGVYKRISIQVNYEEQNLEAFTYTVINKSESEIAPSLEYAQLIYNGAIGYLSFSYRKQLIKAWSKKFGIDYFLEMEQQLNL